MHEFMIIFKQAFITKGRTKSFIISTLIMIAAIFLLANGTKIIDAVKDMTGGSKEKSLYVVDESGLLADQMKIQFEAMESDRLVEKSTESELALTEKVKDGEIDSFVILSLDQTNTIHAKYFSMSAMEFTLPGMIQDSLQSIQTELKANELSLSVDEVQTLFTPIQFEQQSVSPSGKSEEELSQARGLVYVLMFVIYFAVIIYSTMIATEVATEKSSRVMEILISSVSPVKHMFAKIMGIGTLGLLQMALLGTAGYFAFKSSASEMTEGMFSYLGFSNMKIETLIYAVVFFLLAYFLYATLAALLGSLVSRAEDVQQMIMPMTMIIAAAFIIAATGLSNPDMAYVKYTSFFPFFTPIVMFLRVGMLDLPLWEPLLSIVIMILTILFLGWFGAKVYRGGVLMYGPSKSLKDIKKAIQLGKE